MKFAYLLMFELRAVKKTVQALYDNIINPYDADVYICVQKALPDDLERLELFHEKVVYKELYDKLNLIAAAFVTMNKGYLSMSNVKMQLMIEDAKKASISVAVNKKVEIEEPTVEVTQYSDPDKSLTETEIFDERQVGVEGFGGNKKYSRRKIRRHSKRQKKCCRRKSNKRFYSKKCTKKRRKYSKR